MLTDTHRTNLVAALLAVNDFPLSRAYALMPAFGAAGLLDPATVAALPQPALIEAMRAAGYQRGGFLPILSFRLYALMEALVAGSLDSLPGLALSGDKSSFVATLSAVPGFGPRTSENAWVLFTTPG